MVIKRILSLLLLSSLAFAGSNQSIVYQGRLTRPDGTFPDSTVTFTLNVYSPSPSHCLLYSEAHALNLSGAQGLFTLYLGTGTRSDSGAHAFKDIFVNGLALSSLTCSTGNSYTGASTDDRDLEVTVVDGGSTVTFSPIQIKSVPFAMQAHEIDGWGVSNLLKVSKRGQLNDFHHFRTFQCEVSWFSQLREQRNPEMEWKRLELRDR